MARAASTVLYDRHLFLHRKVDLAVERGHLAVATQAQFEALLGYSQRRTAAMGMNIVAGGALHADFRAARRITEQWKATGGIIAPGL